MIAQDPLFNEIDKRLLREVAGLEVVETPAAFDLIDESTFLYAPHLEDKLYSLALAKKPMVTFGNIIEHYMDTAIRPL